MAEERRETGVGATAGRRTAWWMLLVGAALCGATYGGCRLVEREPGPVFMGAVHDEDGAPVAGAVVEVWAVGPPERKFIEPFVAEGGSFWLETDFGPWIWRSDDAAAATDSYRIVVTHPGRRTADGKPLTAEIVVAGRNTYRVEIRLSDEPHAMAIGVDVPP